MMTGLNIARLAKLAALFGFILPWVLVSCSGQPIAHLTGLDLATGGVTVRNPGTGVLQHQQGHPNLWIAATLLLVIAGLVASFVMKGRQAILAVLAASIIALVASVVGVSDVTRSFQDQAQQQQVRGGQPVDQSLNQSMAGLFRVDLEYGYFLTAAGLLAAIAACAMVLTGREGMLTGAFNPAARPPPPPSDPRPN